MLKWAKYSLEDLRYMAGRLGIPNSKNLNQQSLIIKFGRLEVARLKSARRRLWWHKHNGHVYGIIGVIGLLISIIPLFPGKSDSQTEKHFPHAKPLRFVKLDAERYQEARKTNPVVLKDQSGFDIDIWKQDQQLKIVTVGIIGSGCEGTLEVVSMVKQELNPYISTRSYVLFGDTINNPQKVKNYIDTYHLDVVGLTGEFKDVSLLATHQFELPLFYSDGAPMHTPSILVMYDNNLYHIAATNMSAQDLIVTILEKIIKNEKGNAGLRSYGFTDSVLAKVARGAQQRETVRVLPKDCFENRKALALVNEQ